MASLFALGPGSLAHLYIWFRSIHFKWLRRVMQARAMNGKVNKTLWLAIISFATIEFLILVRFSPFRSVPRLLGSPLPELHIWWSLVVFQAVFWGYCVYNAFVWSIELRKEYSLGLILGIRGALLAVVIVGSAIVKLPFVFLPGPEYRYLNLKGLSFLGFISAAVAVQGIWVTEAFLFGPRGIRLDMRRYIRLRDRLDRFLLLAGSILGLGTVSVATLRNLIWALAGKKAFPSEYVVLFGGLYSALLALAYAPAYLAFQWKGAKIRNSLLSELETKLPGSGVQLVEEWASHKSTLENILRLRFREWASLGPGLSILAPLLISVISRLLSAQ